MNYNKIKSIVYGKLIDKTEDRDYAELSEELFGEGNCFNSSEVRKRMYGMKRLIEVIESETVEKITGNDDLVREIEEKTFELQKERYKLADTKREINKQIREAARRDLINEDVINAIKSLNEKQPLQVSDKPVIMRKGDNEGILMLSDWHYGLEVNNYWNNFNVDILETRVKDIVEQVKLHTELYGINKIHIVLNGDFINGHIHTTLRIMSQMDVIDQVIGVSNLLANTIHEISKTVENVNVYSSIGNHSRINSNIKENLNSENLERLIYRFIKERLKFHTNVECIDNIYDVSMVTFDVFDEKVFASHGDKDHCNSVINNMNKMLDFNPSLVLLGHIHHFTSKDFGSGTVITGGSLIGMDDYCVGKRIYGKPYQNMIIVNKELGRIATIELKTKK